MGLIQFMFICIAGKNSCSLNLLKYLISKKINKKNILVLPNQSDDGKDGWQPSLKKFSKKNNFKIVNLNDLYKIKDLFFFSIEYEKIIDVNKFKSKNLFNIHFSLLPKYRGCHTNFYQIYNGEKKSGVTLHLIDSGIDTGNIIDQIKFNINLNHTAFDNYLKLMKCSVIIFKKNFNKILKNKYSSKRQQIFKGSYFSRKSINYNKMKKFVNFKNSLKFHNKVRSFIFPPFQLPIVNARKSKRSGFKNKKVCLYD